MDVKKYHKELETEGHSLEKCNLHYCNDWDGLPLCDHSHEVKEGTCGCSSNVQKNAMKILKGIP